MELDKKKRHTFHILNLALICFFIYVAYIIEGAKNYDKRIIIYIILLFLVLATLLKINLSEERLEQLLIYFNLKANKPAPTDEVKDFIEKYTEKTKQTRAINDTKAIDYAYTPSSNANEQPLGGLGNQNGLNANDKPGDGLFSSRMNQFSSKRNENPYDLSNNKGAFSSLMDAKQDNSKIYGFTRNYINNITYGQGGINEQTFKSRSHQMYSSLIMRHKFHKVLLPGKEVNYDSVMRIPDELSHVNCTYWIERYREFLVSTLLDDFINEHDNNLVSINKALEFTNIQLVQSLPDEDPLNLEEHLQLKFSDSTLIRKLENPQLAYSKDIAHPTIVKIFFGDNSTINQIIQFIEYKLRQSKQSDKEQLRSKEKKDPHLDKTDKFIYDLLKKTNPFLKKELNYDYNDLMTKNQLQLEESYVSLKHHLIHRIIINEKLYTKLFISPINEKHGHLLMEYNIGRLRELKGSISLYKNNSGGKMCGEPWCNAFPTDSQLVAYLSIQFIEDIYKNNAQRKIFLLSFPLAPKLEKDSGNLFIYQSNPEDTEPYFYVVYQDMVINCDERDNFFHAFVVFLYLMKVKNPQLIQSMNLGEFIERIIQ